MHEQITDSLVDVDRGIFTDDEWNAVVALQRLYEQGHDLLNPRERTRLRFLRWLVETGRVEP